MGKEIAALPAGQTAKVRAPGGDLSPSAFKDNKKSVRAINIGAKERGSRPPAARVRHGGESTMTDAVEKGYEWARERYAGLGVDTERALDALWRVPVSLHCWQGDDVGGFES